METPANYQHELFTPRQAAEYLQISTRCLRSLQRRGIIPAIKLTGGIVRFDRGKIQAALTKMTVGEEAR